MKRISILKVLLLLFIVLQVVACSKAGKESYTRIIPKDAVNIISIDVESLYEKSALNRSENNIIANIELMGMPMSASGLVKSIVKDLSASGVDFDSPIYFYSMDKSFRIPGFVAKMGNRSKFMDLLAVGATTGVLKPVVHESSYSYAESSDGEDMVVFTDELITIILKSTGDTKKLIETTLDLPEAESINSMDGFEKMLDFNGDIKAIVAVASLPNNIKMGMSAQVGYDIDSMNIIGSVSFDDGQANIYLSYFSSDATIQKLMDEGLSIAKKMDGDLLKRVPAEALFAMAAYINGPKSWEIIQKNPEAIETLSSEKELLEILEPVLKSLEGDIVISPVSFSSISDFELVAYAQVNSSASSTLEALCSSQDLASSGVVKKGSDEYALETPFVNIYFGIEDGVFYLTNRSGVKVGDRLSSSLSSRYSDSKDDCAFVVLNVQDALALVKKLGMSKTIPRDLPLDQLESIQYNLSADGVVNNLKVVLTDKDVNSLRFFVDFAMSRVN